MTGMRLKGIAYASVSNSIISKLRLDRKLTQKQLAVELGIPRSNTAIADAERGEFTYPGLRDKLSSYYNLPVAWLFDEFGFALEVEE